MRDHILEVLGAKVDKSVGFLESELERAIAAGEANVGPFAANHDHDLLPERERRFRELLDALPAAVYTTDAEGRITYYNDSAAEMWGQRPPLGSSEWCGSWKLFREDGTPLAHDDGDCTQRGS